MPISEQMQDPLVVPRLGQDVVADAVDFPRPVVLVVDDEPSVQLVLDRLLTLNGCQSRQASRLQDVMSVTEVERVDAFLVDMTLKSGESGLDVLAWVRRQSRFRDTPVLVFTGLAILPPADEAFIRAYRARVFYKTDTLRLAVETVKQLLEYRPD